MAVTMGLDGRVAESLVGNELCMAISPPHGNEQWTMAMVMAMGNDIRNDNGNVLGPTPCHWRAPTQSIGPTQLKSIRMHASSVSSCVCIPDVGTRAGCPPTPRGTDIRNCLVVKQWQWSMAWLMCGQWQWQWQCASMLTMTNDFHNISQAT